MKLTELNLFYVILAVLLLSNLGLNVQEYFTVTEEEERPRRRRRRERRSEYILKSKIVPPVCPKCPDSAACPRDKPCPPCPPCARCPEAPFKCAKVPNYRSAALGAGAGYGGASYLPRPVLNDFSQFGM